MPHTLNNSVFEPADIEVDDVDNNGGAISAELAVDQIDGFDEKDI